MAAHRHLSSAITPQVIKSNVLLVRRSGTDMSLLENTLARYLDAAGSPAVSFDCCSLTAPGYKGAKNEDILSALLHQANYNVAKAQQGVVFLNAIDMKRCNPFESGCDIGGRAVQEELLTFIGGTTVTIEVVGQDFGRTKYTLNTKGILFVAAGAFGDLVKANPRSLSPTSQDLIDFGLLPEFLGRFPFVTSLD